GHHRRSSGIDTQRCEIYRRGLHAAARCDRPRGVGLREPGEQLPRAWERAHAIGALEVSGGMRLAQATHALIVDLDPGFTKQLVGEQTAAHADPAMDTPNRQFNLL